MRFTIRVTYIRALAGLLVVSAVAWISAGSLTPPAGPVAPTMKPLTEIEARVAVNNLPGGGTYKHGITQRGSYYLIDNVVSTLPGEIGILIDADHVTLDLNGFSVIGPGSGSGSGIRVNNSHTNIAVRNGSVAGWGGAGVDLGLAIDTVQTELRVIGNAGDGIIAGSAGSITANLCQSNALSGLKVTGTGSHLDGNLCLTNGKGIEVTGNSNVIVRNVARQNTTADFAIATGNDYGQILNAPGANFTAGSPWANFAGCVAGQANCSGLCANLQTDASNCGTCGHVCGGEPNVAAEACSNGACVITVCNAGYGECNNTLADGCETNTNTSVTHCGNCITDCTTLPHVSQSTCSNGSCVILVCNAGYFNCNNVAADGCEVNVNTDPTHCGNCLTNCGNLPHVSNSTCVNGSCVILTCSAGWFDCNGVASDGCEINVTTDPNHCGNCTNVCAAGHPCVGGVCQ